MDKKIQEEVNKTIDGLRKLSHNKQCFDCGEKGTTYVVLDFGTFVCSNCAGIHREFNFKVKGLGVSNFTEKEMNFLKVNGNEEAKKIYLANYDFSNNKHNSKDANAIKSFIQEKFKDKKYMHSDKKKDKKEKEKEKNERGKRKKSSSSSSDQEDTKEDKKKAKKPEKTNEKSQKEKISEKKESEKDVKTAGIQLKKLNIKEEQSSKPITEYKKEEKKKIDFDDFEFFEESKETNPQPQKQTSSKNTNSMINNINFEEIFSGSQADNNSQKNDFHTAPVILNINQQTQLNPSQNIPQNNQKQGHSPLDVDKLFAEKYSSPNQNPNPYQQPFGNQFQGFNNQFPQQQFNPQIMQMVMSNPQLLMQFMQYQQSQQQNNGQMFNPNPQFTNPNSQFTNPNPQFGGQFMGQQNQQFPTINFDNNPPQKEEVKKDFFKDIYSYSENKLQNKTQHPEKIDNFNPFS